jgi:glycolate oxidase iron-sulfur subunit
MRALERGEIAPSDEGLIQHLDACLGCLGCEPVCPSGVGYGRGIEAAREELFAARGLSPLAAAVLAVFSREWVWRPLFTAGRWLRATGVPAWLSSGGRFGFGMAMLAATRPAKPAAPAASRGTATRKVPGAPTDTPSKPPSEAPTAAPANAPTGAPTVALFRGCVMDTLFGHVHQATRRTLEANGYRVVEPEGQVCCGALHEHAGDRAAA